MRGGAARESVAIIRDMGGSPYFLTDSIPMGAAGGKPRKTVTDSDWPHFGQSFNGATAGGPGEGTAQRRAGVYRCPSVQAGQLDGGP